MRIISKWKGPCPGTNFLSLRELFFRDLEQAFINLHIEPGISVIALLLTLMTHKGITTLEKNTIVVMIPADDILP
jgi:hypothetical protein